MATFNGSENPELLFGSGTADTMYGYEGADTLYGAGGSDYISDQSSGNLIYADRYAQAPAEREDGGNDTVIAGLGNTVLGGQGNDYLESLGSSRLEGEAGDDYLRSLSGTNTLVGGSGNDTLRGTGSIWTDDEDDVSPRVGGDTIMLSYLERQASGTYCKTFSQVQAEMSSTCTSFSASSPIMVTMVSIR